MDENTIPPEGVYTASDSYTTSTSRTDNPAMRAVLAGLGAVATACDVAGDTFDRFVERGERVQSELLERTDEVRDRNAGVRGRAEQYYRGAVDALLDRANLPSKGDLEAISVKLNIVSRKLDDLQMDRVMEEASAEPPASTPTSPPVDLGGEAT